MTFTNPAYAIQAMSHNAQLFRQATSSPLNPAGGIVQAGDLALTQNGSPDMSVNVGPGRCWIPGTSLSTVNPGGGAYHPQGLYYAESDAAVNLAISASSPSNPRIDTIIAQVQDAAYAGVTNSVGPAVLTGTPTAGATLANLTGAAALPVSSLVLGYVLVPANATTIVTADLASTALPLALALGGGGGGGAVNIAASESRTNTAYGTLSTPDQVTGIVLPAKGLIAVWYQATWQESVANAANAALFIGSNQIQFAQAGITALTAQLASINSSAQATVLASGPGGLFSLDGQSFFGAYGGDATTGQIVGGGVVGGGTASGDPQYGPCYIFAAAGTYTVSVQFKASSGSVTASNRKLWVQALPFS